MRRISRRELLTWSALGGAALVGAGGLAEFVVSSAARPTRPAHQLDVVRYGADPNGVVNSTDAINRAISDCHAMGGGVVRVPPGTYSVTRRAGAVSNGQGGVYLLPRVSLTGYGATLRMDGNASIIQTSGPTTQSAPVSTLIRPIHAGERTLTVDSSSGFAVGDEVFCRLGENPVDRPETSYWLYARVAGLDGPQRLTLDRPVEVTFDPTTVTRAQNRTVTKLVNAVTDVAITGFRLIQGPSGNVENCIRLDHARRLTVRDITARDPGAGLNSYYSEDIAIDGYQVEQSIKQNGQRSKGRGLTFSGVRNCSASNLRLQGCVGGDVFCENYSQNVHVRDVEVILGGKTDGQGIFNATQRSQLRIESCRVQGSGAGAIFSKDPTSNSSITTRDLVLSTQPELVGGPALAQLSGSFNLEGEPGRLHGDWNTVKTQSMTIQLEPNMSAAFFGLPSGLHRRVTIYASALIGITSAFLVTSAGHGKDLLPDLVAGVPKEMPPQSALTVFGSQYPPVAPTGRGLVVSTGRGLAQGAYLKVAVEYYQADGDGGSGG